MRRPLVGIALSVVGGIWVGSLGWISLEDTFFITLYLLLLTLAFAHSRVSTPLAFLAVASMAMCRFLLVDAAVSDASILRRLPDLPKLGVEVVGTVSGNPEYQPFASESRGMWMFPLRCEAIKTADEWVKQRGSIDVRIVGVAPEPVIRFGQRLRLQGQMHAREYPGGNAIGLKGINAPDVLVLSDPPRFSPRSLATAWRESAVRRLEEGIGTLPVQQAILKALVLGCRKEIPRETMDIFRRTGSLHIFAISGLHVGIIGLLLVIALKSLGVPRDWFGVFLLPLLFLYIVATGMKSSALRAMVMAGVFLLAPLFRRKPDIPNSVAFAAILLLLIDPLELQSAGFVFSFVVVIFIVMVFSVVPDFLLRGGWIKSYAVSLVVTSLAASLASLPMTALYFGRFSPIALLGNLAVVPLTFCIVLSGWLSVLIPAASSVFNHAAVVFINLMLNSVTWLDRIPGSSWTVDPPPLMAVGLWYCSLIYLFVHASHQRQRYCAVAGAGCAVLWACLG